jgi:hypothetical protein
MQQEKKIKGPNRRHHLIYTHIQSHRFEEKKKRMDSLLGSVEIKKKKKDGTLAARAAAAQGQ